MKTKPIERKSGNLVVCHPFLDEKFKEAVMQDLNELQHAGDYVLDNLCVKYNLLYNTVSVECPVWERIERQRRGGYFPDGFYNRWKCKTNLADLDIGNFKPDGSHKGWYSNFEDLGGNTACLHLSTSGYLKDDFITVFIEFLKLHRDVAKYANKVLSVGEFEKELRK